VAGGSIYFVTLSGYCYYTPGGVSCLYSATTDIYQCPTAGGTATLYATDRAPYALATDGTDVFWTNDVPAGTVVACAAGATCASPRTLASGQLHPKSIAVNSSRVFWATTTQIESVLR
jgi:hypothetical protein